MKKQYLQMAICIAIYVSTIASSQCQIPTGSSNCDYRFAIDIKFHIVAFEETDVDICGGECDPPHLNFEEAYDPGNNEIFLNDALADMQSYYSEHEIFFSKKETNYIFDDNLANTGSMNALRSHADFDHNALNIFIVPRSNTQPITYAIGSNTIVIGRNYQGLWVNVHDTTFPHEVGHALGLYHTYHQGHIIGNCETTGDRVCDTPRTQETGENCGNSAGNCSMCSSSSINRVNLMSKFPDECRQEFTAGQVERMRNQMLNNPNVTPYVTATLRSLAAPPISGSDCFEITPGTTTHEFYNLPGAMISEADQFNWSTTFGTITKCYKKVNGNYVLTNCHLVNSGKATNAPIPALPQDRIVRIRISQTTIANPFGFVPSGGSFTVKATAQSSCQSRSTQMQVSIENECVEIPRAILDPIEIDATAFPNPVKHDQVGLNFNAEVPGKYRVVLVNALTGQQQELMIEDLEAGQQSFEFKHLGLESNLYFLRIESPNGVTTKRLLNEKQ
ncbi:MAG: M43 family zinc metalloprotease [Cytophagales bacterium]|nr:M43 family zinc metalloprotease [Cytophagales bacterium]